MLYVALALAAALVVLVVAFGGIVRSLIRQHARERELLVQRMCHLADRPIVRPEAPFHHAPEPELSFVAPDQWPDGDL